jgi:hypothetical protein
LEYGISLKQAVLNLKADNDLSQKFRAVLSSKIQTKTYQLAPRSRSNSFGRLPLAVQTSTDINKTTAIAQTPRPMARGSGSAF